jgi:hypothetical protein
MCVLVITCAVLNPPYECLFVLFSSPHSPALPQMIHPYYEIYTATWRRKVGIAETELSDHC